MTARKFKNFTNTEFTWSFDSIPYTFKAGQEIYLEDYKAEHFAKHLVDRELNEMNKPTDNRVLRKELTDKCFPSDEVVTPVEALDLNKGKTAETPKVEVEEFPDLKVPKKKKK